MSTRSKSEGKATKPATLEAVKIHLPGWMLGAAGVWVLGLTALSNTGYLLMLPPMLRYGAFAVLSLLALSTWMTFRWFSRRLVRVRAVVHEDGAGRAGGPADA